MGKILNDRECHKEIQDTIFYQKQKLMIHFLQNNLFKSNIVFHIVFTGT